MKPKMTNDEIRDLALSHGFTLRSQPDGAMDLNPYVYAFARALVEQELEECAKLCEQRYEKYSGELDFCFDTPEECAKAIRARGES